ncbi:MAG: hypothetical protein JKX85_11320 [Phycisphaeraceae bacterium]|nr:hypothetical protein [Phycisphaeraceae bacterium]
MTVESPEPLQTVTAVIDHAQLMSLFRDVAALTQVIDVNVKGPAMSPNADACRVEITEALHLIETGAARGVQLRYEHDGSVWFDTITPVAADDQWQIVRIQHDSPASTDD